MSLWRAELGGQLSGLTSQTKGNGFLTEPELTPTNSISLTVGCGGQFRLCTQGPIESYT